MCTDGVQRTVNVDKSLNYPKGWLVEIRVTPEGESVSGIENKVVTGKVNADATALGSYALADDVQILDTTAEGVAGTVRPSRLAGTDLNLLNVRYYTLNEKGEIDRLILNDVTGDLWTYGVLDDIKNVAVNYSELQTLAKIISTGKSDSTDTQDKIVDDLKDVLVPTTSEVLWGVINGDILSTLWQKITANTDSLLSLGLRQVGSLVGEPYASIFRYIWRRCYLCVLCQWFAGSFHHQRQISGAGRWCCSPQRDDRQRADDGPAHAHEDRSGGCSVGHEQRHPL